MFYGRPVDSLLAVRDTELSSSASMFVWPVRVYYEDTDAGGVVYYANYLKFLERARTEWLRSLGFEQDRLREQEGIIFAVRSIQVEFHKPARFNERLGVTVQPLRCKPASILLAQSVLQGAAQRLLCRGTVKIACLNADSFIPRALPRRLVAEIPSD